MTVNEAARAAGIQVFDSALPQPWVDQVRARTGLAVRGNFAWSYDRSLLGCPAPVTAEGRMIESDLLERGLLFEPYSTVLAVNGGPGDTVGAIAGVQR